MPDACTAAITLCGLDEDTSAAMEAELLRQGGVEFDNEILALAARRLEGNPMYIKDLMRAARGARQSFVSLRDFADLYAFDVAGGNISFALTSVIKIKTLADLRVLFACAAVAETSEEALRDDLRYPKAKLERIIKDLGEKGLIEAG
ncbi:MAG: hypothetical protein HZB83_08800, partial [Deltaproteobacteria bacterium]|nr:hypothetical protein [Deltaproteobacteria bacterium]